MIRKNDKHLLHWVYENIIDFTNKDDKSGLRWTSSRYEAKNICFQFLKGIEFKNMDFILLRIIFV